LNPFGSYRALLGNSMSAMLAGIEIYNKPRIDYRSECFVIMLLNSWELLFKAICSKNRIRIFEPKERRKPYRTMKLWDAYDAAKSYFPNDIPAMAVAENIGRLADYRNNAVHFYNEESLGVIIYGLAQTSIVNYRDIVYAVFGKDIASEVNIALLPLSFAAPPDPIKLLGSPGQHTAAVAEFLHVISDTTRELEKDGVDTGRFLTVFEINLQSTKKIESADIVAGVQGDASSGLLLVSKKVDPNNSHPHRTKDVLERIGGALQGVKFTSYTFQAVVWRYSLKEKEQFCWRNKNTNTVQYSDELVGWLRKVTAADLRMALSDYRDYLRLRRAR
jgi:hypothetical protein